MLNNNYMRFVVAIAFLVCGQFGYIRPFQEYGSGPGTPLAHKLEGCNGMGCVGAWWRFLLRAEDCQQPA